MIQAHICNPAAEQPFRSFEENTTRYVCLPEDADFQLYVDADGPGQLRIEADGEELFSAPVGSSTRCFPLAAILTPRPLLPKAHPLGLFSSLRGSAGEGRPASTIRSFSAIVTRDEDAGSVAATFAFNLLPPSEFERAFNDHLERVGRNRREAYAVDWQMSQTPCCWNCAADNPGTCCGKCGADQTDGE